MRHDPISERGGVALGRWNRKMQRIDAGYVYELGDTVRCLRQFRLKQEIQAFEIWGPLNKARQKVNEFLTNSVFMYGLRTVRPSAQTFLAALDALLGRMINENMGTLNALDVAPVMEAFDRFEPVLASELSSLTTYLVQPKGAYDVAVLVDSGELMFPQSLLYKAPEVIHDIQQGSKSLAFELWTAAAFHFHRANESVLRRYFDQVAGKEKRPKTVTMGTLLAKLKELGVGHPNIIAALDNLKEFHRNPISHPGANINSVDECLDLVAAVRASMGYMLDKLPLAPAHSGFVPPALVE